MLQDGISTEWNVLMNMLVSKTEYLSSVCGTSSECHKFDLDKLYPNMLSPRMNGA